MFSLPLYIFDLFTQNKYFLFVITNKKIYFIKTDFIEERRPGLVTSEGFAYIFVKMLAGPHRHHAKVNLYHHKKTLFICRNIQEGWRFL